jgi:hypothetical protein
MRRISVMLMASLAAAAGAALAADSGAVQREMKIVVDPASNLLFAIGGEVDPANGPAATPVSGVRWREAGQAAGKIKRVAAAMQTPAQIQPGREWMIDSKRMADLSEAAEHAARGKDRARLAQAADDLGDVCTTCHAKYRPKRRS